MAAVFFLLGAFLRLLMGPVSLGPFATALGASLSDALPGLSVHYDEAAVEWSRDEGKVNIVVLGARVFDRSQRIIAQAPKAEIDLAAAPLLDGKVAIRRIALVGVQLTLVHTLDGTLRLGIERDREQSDVLKELREALSSSGGHSALKSFAVRKARLAFYDERTGLFVVAPQASVQIATDPAAGGTVAAAIDAQIEISGHRASMVANLKLPRDGQTVAGDVSITGLAVNALGENAKALAFLKPYGLTTDMSGSFVLDQGSTHLHYADFGLGATGTISGLGHPVRVKALRLVGRYDGTTGRLLIEDGSLAGNEARARLTGWGNLSFNSSGGLQKGNVDLTLDRIGVNMPGVMQQALTLARVALRASYTPDDNTLDIQDLLVTGGPLSASLNGKVVFSPGQTPAIAVNGRMAPLSAHALLEYWPLKLGEGARAWIAANVSDGNVGPVMLTTNITAGALDLPVLPDAALNLSFPIQNGTITYLRGLTPLSQMTGTGTLTGNSFTATVSSAMVGPLKVSAGKVVIADISVPRPPGTITAHVEGAFGDVLRLIDMKPLGYPTRFGINTASAKGAAAVDLSFDMPMVRDLSVNDVKIAVNGKIDGLGLSIGSHSISNGAVSVAINNSSLHAAGKVNLAGADLTMDWMEQFSARNAVTTQITAAGLVDDAAREQLNFHSAKFLKGPVPIEAKLQGHRGSITQAHLTMDLTPATLTLDLIDYRKPPGTAATAEITARFKKGVIAGEDIALSGTDLAASGTAAFGPDGTLQRLDVPEARVGPDNDFTFHLAHLPAKGFSVTLSGRAADGAGLGHADLSENAGQPDKTAAPDNEPFDINVNLGRLVLRKGVTLSPFAFSTSGVGDRPQAMTLSGTLSKTTSLHGVLVTEGGERKIHLNTNDTGLLVKGLFGFSGMRGGEMNLTAALSPKPTTAEIAANHVPDYRGEVAITNFTVVNQPFLTRLLSAGSFGGLIDLLRGGGIAVDRLAVPFSMQSGVLTIHDARASGPSVGITADGYVDRRSNKLALEGALAPVYGLNGALGAIPLLGDVLVSKKGEGIIGVSYSVTGNTDEPEISVNPLSMLTPGILRRIFEGTPHAPQAPPNPAKPKAPAKTDPNVPKTP